MGYGGKFGLQNIQDKSAFGNEVIDTPKIHKTVEVSVELMKSKGDIRSKFDRISIASNEGGSNVDEKRKKQQEQIKLLREEGEKYLKSQEEENRFLKDQEQQLINNARSQYNRNQIEKEEKAHKEREQKFVNSTNMTNPADIRAAEVRAAIAERDRQLKAESDKEIEKNTKIISFQPNETSFQSKSENQDTNISKPVKPTDSYKEISPRNSLKEETNEHKSSFAAPITLPPRQTADTDDTKNDEWDETESSKNSNAEQTPFTEKNNNYSVESSFESNNQHPIIAEQLEVQENVSGQTAKALYDYEAGIIEVAQKIEC